jgi:hypothetical protein
MRLVAVSACAALLSGAGLAIHAQRPAPGAAPPAAAGATGVQFTDVTAASGVSFRHVSGAAGKRLLPETMGSGVAVFDMDGDGAQDLFFVNSMRWPGQRGATPALPALYRNSGRGTFTNVTRAAGLAVEMYGLGAAPADYDNDGRVDLYVTALGPNRLYRNVGGGVFTDVTAAAGVGDPGFSTGAAWLDYDRDGRLDLYVANYVQWTPATDLFCTLDGKTKSYCTPESYKGASGTLYRNRGNGTFEDVTRRAGLQDPASKALGVAIIEHNADGHVDLFVSNDTQPNRLYENTGKGTFVDVAVQAGVAFNEAGVARAGMGVDAADYDGSGRPGIIIGNFANETMSLYTNEGTGLFVDEAPASTLGRATLMTLTFACFFFDYDLDGRPDIFAANGHVADDIERVQPKVKYAQPAQLFRNLGGRRFEDVSRTTGAALQVPRVARGAAYGDLDNDGDLDVVLTVNNGPAVVLRNDGGNRNGALRVFVRGVTTNRDGIGARIALTREGQPAQVAYVKSGSSYLSQSERAVTFGLGALRGPATLQVTWPGGRVEKVTLSNSAQTVLIEEGKGVQPLRVSTPRSEPRERTTSRAPGTRHRAPPDGKSIGGLRGVRLQGVGDPRAGTRRRSLMR